MNNEIETVWFGIMVGDLFASTDSEELDRINEDESVAKYAAMIERAIKNEYGDHVDIDWSAQNVGGVVPHTLRTRVNGGTADDWDTADHVADVDEIIGNVWQEWEWVVYK